MLFDTQLLLLAASLINHISIRRAIGLDKAHTFILSIVGSRLTLRTRKDGL